MIGTYKFYKTSSNKWYVDLPEWTGSIDDLELVCGADIMLDIIAQGETNIYLTLSDIKIEHATELVKYIDTPLEGGAEYIFTNWHGIEYNMNIWLCDVTKYVFGIMPESIWII